MEHIAPLIQTLLWVGLIAIILRRFHAPIHGFLVALQRRVEAGCNLKAGPFELSGLKPQDRAKQKERARAEVQEVLQTAATSDPVQVGSSASARIASTQARYLQAEDLVLRAIQVEYGATVSRQVTLGLIDVDGAFTTNGRLNIVEVKYIAGPACAVSRLRASVDQLVHAISRYDWRNIQIILAVVFEKAEEVARGNDRLQELSASSVVPLVIRCFSFAELEREFGIAGQDSG